MSQAVLQSAHVADKRFFLKVREHPTKKKPFLVTTRFVASIVLDKAVNNLLAYLTVLLNNQPQIFFCQHQVTCQVRNYERLSQEQIIRGNFH